MSAVSVKQLGAVLDEVTERLTDTSRAALIKIVRQLADGYEGAIHITVGQGGSIRFVEWTHRDDGATLKEYLG